MSSFEEEILGLIPEIDEERRARQETRDATRHAQREQERQEMASDEEAGRLGRHVVEILERHDISPNATWDRSDEGTEPEKIGWHVLTKEYIKGRDEPESEYYLIDINGAVRSFWYPVIQQPERQRLAARTTLKIVSANSPLRGSVTLELLQTDPFKRGLASLLGKHGPYTEQL